MAVRAGWWPRAQAGCIGTMCQPQHMGQGGQAGCRWQKPLPRGWQDDEETALSTRTQDALTHPTWPLRPLIPASVHLACCSHRPHWVGDQTQSGPRKPQQRPRGLAIHTHAASVYPSEQNWLSPWAPRMRPKPLTLTNVALPLLPAHLASSPGQPLAHHFPLPTPQFLE